MGVLWRLVNAEQLSAQSLAAAGGKMPIDENHATDLAAPEGQPSPARGWIVALNARADSVHPSSSRWMNLTLLAEFPLHDQRADHTPGPAACRTKQAAADGPATLQRSREAAAGRSAGAQADARSLSARQ
jgi:hypothetical protein